MDYALFARDRSRVYFVELKTDEGSRRLNQDRYLARARDSGFREVVKGIRSLFLKTKAHQKYYHLAYQLSELGFLSLPSELEERIFPKPGRGLRQILETIEVMPVDPPIEVIYLQPNRHEGEACIDFQFLAAYLDRFDDPLSEQFRAHLLRWNAPAGSVPPLRE